MKESAKLIGVAESVSLISATVVPVTRSDIGDAMETEVAAPTASPLAAPSDDSLGSMVPIIAAVVGAVLLLGCAYGVYRHKQLLPEALVNTLTCVKPAEPQQAREKDAVSGDDVTISTVVDIHSDEVQTDDRMTTASTDPTWQDNVRGALQQEVSKDLESFADIYHNNDDDHHHSHDADEHITWTEKDVPARDKSAGQHELSEESTEFTDIYHNNDDDHHHSHDADEHITWTEKDVPSSTT